MKPLQPIGFEEHGVPVFWVFSKGHGSELLSLLTISYDIRKYFVKDCCVDIRYLLVFTTNV